MKVIASSLRKGAVVDIDGKLYVVLSAENIHPGKGTPVTQLNMRRISDGVKIAERYRTTEQVERAFVDDRKGSACVVADLADKGGDFRFHNTSSARSRTRLGTAGRVTPTACWPHSTGGSTWHGWFLLHPAL